MCERLETKLNRFLITPHCVLSWELQIFSTSFFVWLVIFYSLIFLAKGNLYTLYLMCRSDVCFSGIPIWSEVQSPLLFLLCGSEPCIQHSGAFRDQILIHVLYRLNKCCHSVFKLCFIVHNGNKELVSSICAVFPFLQIWVMGNKKKGMSWFAIL